MFIKIINLNNDNVKKISNNGKERCDNSSNNSVSRNNNNSKNIATIAMKTIVKNKEILTMLMKMKTLMC